MKLGVETGTERMARLLNKGTRFVIRWPRSKGEIAPERGREREIVFEGEGQTIVVAEDNDTMRTFLKRLLTQRGFEVETARNGEEAIALLSRRRSPPDMILSDVIMPGMTGPRKNGLGEMAGRPGALHVRLPRGRLQRFRF